MDKYLFILNPVAGKGNSKKVLPKINSLLKTFNHPFEIKSTEYKGHATIIMREIGNNYNYIVSIGGDGTLNEIINGINVNSNIKLCVLPVGSGNDFSGNLNLPKNIDDQLSLLFNKKYNEKSLDVGLAKYFNYEEEEQKKQLFLNNLGIGFDAYVAFLNQEDKILSGIVSYLIAVIRGLVRYKPLNVECIFNSDVISGKKLLITIGNGKSSGGGFYLNPKAEINDNLLDLTIIDDVSRYKILKSLPLALINKIETVNEVSMYKFNHLEIKLAEPYYIHADGEVFSKNVERLEVKLVPNSLKILCL